MRLGDLTSLFQLGVALNLGFGALLSFVEPAKKQRDSSIYLIESELLILAERQEAERPSDEVVEEIFDISRRYRKLHVPTIFSALESYFWEGVVTRSVFLVCGLLAFVGLVTASAKAGQEIGFQIIFVGILLNIPAIVVAALLVGISFWYNYSIFPIIDDLQARLFKYRSLLRSPAPAVSIEAPQTNAAAMRNDRTH